MQKLILINQDGSYNYWSFEQYNQYGTIVEEEIWTLIGSKMANVSHKNPMLMIDTFKSNLGNYKERQRALVFNAALDKKIFVVPESKIKPMPTFDKQKAKKQITKEKR